jgi:integrase
MTSISTQHKSDSQHVVEHTHTYRDLRRHATSVLAGKAASKKVIENYCTALNSWMSLLGLTHESLVGVEMTTGFDSALIKVIDELTITGKIVKRTVQDRCELMLKWRGLFLRMHDVDTLPETFAEALVQAMRRAGMTTGDVARASGLDAQRLRIWEKGTHTPKGSGIDEVMRLEATLKLPSGVLTRRLGLASLTWQAARAHARASTPTRTAFGHRMSELGKRETRVCYISPPEGQLRSQWQRVIAYKVDLLGDDATPANTWALKKLGDTGSRLSPANVLDGMVCASADACWGYVGAYLGWLKLAEEHGGCGLASERVTSLAWLTRQDKVLEYLAWRQRRSGGVTHKGMLQVLNNCCMFLRPETGWIWRHPDLAGTMDVADRVLSIEGCSTEQVQNMWREKCAQAHARYLDRATRLGLKGVLRDSRDSAISDILVERRPLQVAMRMIAKLEAAPPPRSASMAWGVWARDVLLLKMLASNPLRVSHFAIMRYRNDNRGNLFRKADGGWGLRFLADTFKNVKHAAHKDYNADIPKSIWPDIERYLREGRPVLADAHTDFLFLRAPCGVKTGDDGALCSKSAGREGMWRSENISHRIGVLTSMLRPGFPSFRSHAFRHIVATDYLKRNPGAYVLVAHLLHDKLSTVMKVYGHLSVQDGLDRHFESFEEEWSSAVNG